MSAVNTLKEEVRMTEPTNVIKFPKENKRKNAVLDDDVKTEQDIEDRVGAIREMHIEDVVDALADQHLHMLISGGFPIDTEDQARDFAFFVEVLRSMLSRKYDMHHQFQEIADAYMSYDKERDEFDLRTDLTFTICDGDELNDDQETEAIIEFTPEAKDGAILVSKPES